MKAVFRISSRLGALGVAVSGALLVGYFVYHTIHGDRGYVALTELQLQVAEARATLTQLQVQRERLEHRAAGLVNGRRDPDLVDQQARVMLHVARPDDLVLFYQE